MHIGILTPSIYMYEKLYKDRIFAPGELARQLVKGLVQKGHQVTWFSAPEDSLGSDMVSGDLNLLTRDLQIRVFQDIAPDLKTKMSLYGTKMYYELDLLSRAYEKAKKDHIDVMHNFHSFGYMAHFFEEMTDVPTVYTLHDPIPTDDMLERWLLDRFPTHKYISISDRQRGKLESHFLGTVYNGIDVGKFTFNATPASGLLSIGRMIPDKGHDIAIQVARAASVPLRLATWITDSVTNSLYYKEKIAPFVDGKQIIVDSLMQGNALVSAYQNARALLFPLQWEEPFGLIMTEAMSCGTPVIAYNRGSVSELVEDGVTGFVIDPDDEDRPKKGSFVIKKQGVDGLIEAIKRVEEIDRVACRNHVEAHFGIDSMVQGYEHMYEKILSERRVI